MTAYKKYYDKNKDILIAKLSEKVVCECGREVIKSSLYRHRKSKEHLGIPKILKKYECHYCNYATKHSDSYQKHLKTYKHRFYELEQNIKK